jgi:Translation initiation factor eIF3 subunit
VIESDLEAAKSLFGDLGLPGSKMPALATPLESSNPKTRAEFDEYIKTVMKKFETFEVCESDPVFDPLCVVC